jgi:hypothetical protein
MRELREYDAVRLVRDDPETGLSSGASGVILSENEGGTFLVEFFLDADEPALGELFRVPAAELALEAA